MKNSIFGHLDAHLISFWKEYELSEEDFYCKECCKLMLDLDDASKMIWIDTAMSGKKLKNPFFGSTDYEFKYSRTKPYVESANNRWLIFGKKIDGKTMFRKICWDCFFKHLPEFEDIYRKARKNRWYAKISKGIFEPPGRETAPSSYFQILFDVSKETLERISFKYKTASLEHFVHKYGEIEGKLKFDEYRKRQAYTCSKEYMQKTKGWSDEQWHEYNANRASTKENFLKRYGVELGNEKWRKYCAHEAYAGCTLTYFIDKYGKEAGIKHYNEMYEKKLFKLKTFSNISQTLFEAIDDKLGSEAISSRWEKKNFEYEVFLEIDGTRKIAKVDYCLDKKIIEFNGDFWHANPSIYNANDFLPRFNNTKIKAENIWNNDKKRLDALRQLGYEVKVVWEKDYLTNKQKIIDDCIKFLNS